MELMTVEQVSPAPELYRALEAGNLLFFPRIPFDLPEESQAYLRGIAQTSQAFHKNIAYRPGPDKVTGFDDKSVADPEKLRSVLRDFSNTALDFLRRVFPRYTEGCRLDYASFRGVEEEGRDLSFKKRNDLLHIDAFPTRPTGGDLILRTFANIHPTRSRVWLTSDPFAPLAHRYAADAGWRGASGSGLASLFTRRTAYDRFMLHFHDYLKSNSQYQESCAKYRWEFPPGSAWMVFTDIVPHAVLSGQHALEQTIIVRRDALLTPASAPVEILKTLGATR